MAQIIAQRYQLLEELGQGGMGTVYRGLDTHTKQTVAIKQLKPELTTPELIERFVREGTALRELNHPNIVKMLDSAEEDGNHYLIIEYLSGGDLSDLLKAGRLPIEKVLQLAIDICDALTRAHRLDIIHRDLKPANVLLADDGTPRLTDFGIARIGKQERVTATDAIVGTVDYLAPEALDGSEIDARADIWAFGVMLFEILAAERPFKGVSVAQTLMAIVTQPVPDLEALRPDAPVALIDLIYRMLEKSRDARIRSVRQVGLELEDILHGRTQQTPPETRFAPETPNLLTRPKHNLPTQTTPFVGRESELSELAKLLNNPKIRLITILASGGMGKTRLALEAAEQQITNFENGVYFAELAPLADPANIVSAIAEATSYQFQADGREPKQQILDFLANKNMLLVLDNYEHLLEGAPLVTDILKAAPQVKILATSRQRLNQSGETLFNLEGMDFPAWETPADALEYAAVKLFLQSAKRAKPDFEITADNMDAIARICKLVQGMPLGIVLAAAWLSMLSPYEIADEIVKSIDFLESELSDLPERHQSIRAVFDYSWDLLTDGEKQVFMKLSVFRGGFTREAAEAVAGANLRSLMNLMNKSLIQREVDHGRYGIHELLRQYGQVQLENTPDNTLTHEQHGKYYMSILEEIEPGIKGQKQLQAFHAIEADFENISAGWFRTLKRQDYHSIDKTLECLLWYFSYRGHLQIAQDMFHKAEEAFSSMELAELVFSKTRICRIRMLTFQLSTQQYHQNYREILEAELQEGLKIAVKHNDQHSIGLYLWLFGNISFRIQNFDKAIEFWSQSLALFQELHDPFYVAYLLFQLGAAYNFIGQRDKFYGNWKQSLTMKRELGDEVGMTWLLTRLGLIDMQTGKMGDSRQALEEAHAIRQKFGQANSGLSTAKAYLGLLEFFQGNFSKAAAWAESALLISNTINDHEGKTTSLSVQGLIACLNQNYVLGQKLLLDAQRSAVLIEHLFPVEYGLGLAAYGLGDYAQVKHWLSLTLKRSDDPFAYGFVILSLPLAAMLYVNQGNNTLALSLLSLAYNLDASPKQLISKWAIYSDLLQQLKTELSEEVYNAAWERGKLLDLETVVQELLAEFGEDA